MEENIIRFAARTASNSHECGRAGGQPGRRGQKEESGVMDADAAAGRWGKVNKQAVHLRIDYGFCVLRL
jgi:hypothetical protein